VKLHELKPAPGAHKERKRLGRGTGTGQGTTAGKGTKGEKARSGGLKAGFRGMSSRSQRMAKRRGFTNNFKTHYQIVNVEKLAVFDAGATIDAASLKAARLVNDETKPIKILGSGEIDKALNVVNVPVTAGARQKIEAAGGSITEPVVETEATE